MDVFTLLSSRYISILATCSFFENTTTPGGTDVEKLEIQTYIPSETPVMVVRSD